MLHQPENTIVDFLKYNNSIRPTKIAYRFLKYDKEEDIEITFEILFQKSKIIATQLQQATQKGDRVLLVFPQGPEFIISFYACLLSGLIAVPVNTPGNKRKTSRLQGIIKDCKPKVILTNTYFKNKGEKWFNSNSTINWLAYEDLEQSKKFQFKELIHNKATYF